MDFLSDQAVVEYYGQRDPEWNFDVYNGVNLTKVLENGVMTEMVITPEKLNVNRNVHGGALYTMADSTAGLAAWVWVKRNIGESAGSTTLSGSIEYLRPAGPDGTLFCKATVHKAGRSIAIIDTTIFNEADVEICTGRFTCFFIDVERYRKDS